MKIYILMCDTYSSFDEALSTRVVKAYSSQKVVEAKINKIKTIVKDLPRWRKERLVGDFSLAKNEIAKIIKKLQKEDPLFDDNFEDAKSYHFEWVKMEIYVVLGSTGCYDDFTEWMTEAYIDETKANERVSELELRD